MHPSFQLIQLQLSSNWPSYFSFLLHITILYYVKINFLKTVNWLCSSFAYCCQWTSDVYKIKSNSPVQKAVQHLSPARSEASCTLATVNVLSSSNVPSSGSPRLCPHSRNANFSWLTPQTPTYLWRPRLIRTFVKTSWTPPYRVSWTFSDYL